MKVLLTGGSGLVGGRLLARLQEEHTAFALVRRISGPAAPNWEEIHVDLARAWSVEVLPSQIDVVVHLAQSGHFREFPRKALDVFGVNVATTAKLLDFAVKAGARQFILASSGGVYGRGREGFSEEGPIQPAGELGYYLGSKLCMEILAEQYAGLLDVTILRFFFVYGPGQHRAMLISRLVDSVRAEVPIELAGKDGIRINPIHVEDAAKAVMGCLDLQGSHKINIAGPEVLCLREIGEFIGIAVGKAPTFEVRDEKPMDLVGVNRKMRELLSPPVVCFREGIRSVTMEE